MQARVAGLVRGQIAFTRFRRLRGAVSICIRVATPRFYVRLYARRLRAARVAYDVACDAAAAATDTTPAINAAARAAAAVAVWQAARAAAARPLRNMMMKALCRRRITKSLRPPTARAPPARGDAAPDFYGDGAAPGNASFATAPRRASRASAKQSTGAPSAAPHS